MSETRRTSLQSASWGRRILALFIDWGASMLVVIAFAGVAGWQESPLYTWGVFVLESTFLTALAGGSFGKLATRLRVVRNDGTGRYVDPLRALLRSALILLVIPPLVFTPDGRGLHDIAAGSATRTLDDVLADRHEETR